MTQADLGTGLIYSPQSRIFETSLAVAREVSASDLLLTLFGQDRLPVRSALGVHTLPMGIPVEIDSIFELKRQRRAELRDTRPV